MRVVIDGLPIRGRNSMAVVMEQLLGAWAREYPADVLDLAVGPDAQLTLPDTVTVHKVRLRGPHYPSRVRAQATVIPRLCHSRSADVLLGVLPTTAVVPLPCPRVVMAWDLRHELRPEQFTRRTRLLRGIGYEIGYRQADAIVTISERTRDDLLRSRRWLAKRRVVAAPLGGDHVDGWPRPASDGPRYALTFGQWANKHVDLVVEAWRHVAPGLDLHVIGLGAGPREALEQRLRVLGLPNRVRALPWLDDAAFQAKFTGAALIVFASDFEGFGLPAVEAMRLGIPLVVSADPALLEVTGSHAIVTATVPDALAAAVEKARARTPQDLEAARERAGLFTWARTATLTRAALAAAAGR